MRGRQENTFMWQGSLSACVFADCHSCEEPPFRLSFFLVVVPASVSVTMDANCDGRLIYSSTLAYLVDANPVSGH